MSSVKGVPPLEEKATALTENVARNAAVSVLITGEAWQEITREKESSICATAEAAQPDHFLNDEDISGDESSEGEARAHRVKEGTRG